MRIVVQGNSESVFALRATLWANGLAACESAPFPPAPHFTVLLEVDDSRPSVYVDSVDSEMEWGIVREISRLVKSPIEIDRHGGVIASDQKIRVVCSKTDSPNVELGIARGILSVLQSRIPGEVPPKRVDPPRLPWWKRWFPFLACLMLATALCGQTEPTEPPSPLSAEEKLKIQTLRIEAYQFLTQQLKAEVDAAKAKERLEEVNARLTTETQALYKRRGAEGKWALQPDFTWTEIKPVLTSGPKITEEKKPQ
jgi:hypothetical protein